MLLKIEHVDLLHFHILRKYQHFHIIRCRIHDERARLTTTAVLKRFESYLNEILTLTFLKSFRAGQFIENVIKYAT
jgi:hypothetical protein